MKSTKLTAAAALFALASLALPAARAGEPSPPEGKQDPAAEPAKPAYPAATAAEAREIQELLGRLAPPAELLVPSAEEELGDPLLKPPFDKDPIAWLAKTPEEKEALAKQLAAMSEEERGKFLGEHKTRLKAEIEAMERLRALRSREFAGEGVLPKGVDVDSKKLEEEMRKAQEAEARRHAARESRRKALEEHKRSREEAVAKLKGFGSKGVPFVAEAFAKADFETGAVLVDFLASVPKDPRGNESIVQWLNRQSFAEPLANGDILARIAGMKLPGALAAFDQALSRAHSRNQLYLLNACYESRSVQNLEEVVGVFLRYLVRGEELSRQGAMNFLLMLIPDPQMPPSVKTGVVRRLVQALFSREYEQIHASIAWGLGQSGHAEAVRPLVQALSNQRLTKTAVKALGTLGPVAKDAVRDLLPFLSERAPASLKREAIQALGSIGSDEAVSPLIEVLNQSDQPAETLQAVGVTLQRITGQSLGFNNGARWAEWWQGELERRAREGK
jgi:hypothetical protein